MDAEVYTLSLFGNRPLAGQNKYVEKTINVPWKELRATFLTQHWSPSVFENKARNLDNCRGLPSVFGFDIDGGMTLEEAKIAFKDYKCIIYTTRNHQEIKNKNSKSEKPACDRFRVVFALSEPLNSEADFKATWEAYAAIYPIDKQTNNFAQLFFSGKDVVFDNPTGKPLQVVKAKTWEEVTEEQYDFKQGSGFKGQISKRSLAFLNDGVGLELFNVSLFKCAVDHLEQKYSEQEFIDIFNGSLAVKKGIFHEADEVDLRTIQSAFNREPKYGTRKAPGHGIYAEQVKIVRRIMDNSFLQVVLPKNTLWYQITDRENQEVVHFENEQILERHIKSEIVKPENHYETTRKVENAETGKTTFVPTSKILKVSEVLEIWRQEGAVLKTLPEPILWRETPGWCHKRFTFDPVPGGSHPAWDEYLSRLSHPDIFMAWVYGCFEPEHESRQALWMYGPNGEDGKTKVGNVISSFFGEAAATIAGNQISANSRFLMSNYMGKRFVMYSDCKMTSFPMTEVFRNLTGADRVMVEFKGLGFVSPEIKTKLLINSNFLPEITKANSDKSRLIVINVSESKQKDDPVVWTRRLTEEFPEFLGNAAAAFRKLCPNNGKITLPKSMEESLDEMAEEGLEIEEAFFQEHFKIDKTSPHSSWARANAVVNLINSLDRYRAKQLLKSFKDYLFLKHKIKKLRDTPGLYYKYLVFLNEDVQKKANHSEF